MYYNKTVAALQPNKRRQQRRTLLNAGDVGNKSSQ